MKLSEIQVSYHPKSADRPQIKTSQDAYEIIKPLYSEDFPTRCYFGRSLMANRMEYSICYIFECVQ